MFFCLLNLLFSFDVLAAVASLDLKVPNTAGENATEQVTVGFDRAESRVRFVSQFKARKHSKIKPTVNYPQPLP